MKEEYVKCLICGAVFLKENKTCPICGVGNENFIDTEVESTPEKKGKIEEETSSTEERIVILGQGIAAISVIEEIRKHNKLATIIVITDENTLAVNRPMLTKEMLGSINRRIFYIHDEKWYLEQKIILYTCETIINIDPLKQEVHTSSGLTVNYDKCVYALGATNFIPNFPNVNLPEVISIRTLDDVRAIQHIIKSNPSESKVVIIGGGVLGLEAAISFVKDGNNVTIIENTSHLLSKQIDIETSNFLENLLAKQYIKVYTNRSVSRINGKNHVESITLDDNEIIDADLIIVSCGVRANIDVARKSNINTNRAIIVNKYMQTNYDNIYACGDCAEFEGKNYSLWSEAQEMGIVAARNICGIKTEYNYRLLPLIVENLLYASGDIGLNNDIEYEMAEYKNVAEKLFVKAYYLDNVLVGFALVGNISYRNYFEEALAKKYTYQKMNEDLNKNKLFVSS